MTPYRLKPLKLFIRYNRNELQQVAKEKYYRAKEKLVYKFVSDKLVFAYDESATLVLNSANILIPRAPTMSTKTVLAFLNTELYQYLYRVLFAEIKILKGNLLQLPFPLLSEKQERFFPCAFKRFSTAAKPKPRM